MSDSLSAIDDDMDFYIHLCNKYKEKPKYMFTSQGVRLPDCYGKHAKKLEKRLRKEQNKKLERS